MQPKSATTSGPTSNHVSRGAGLLSPWFKEKGRQIVAHGLYRTGLLRTAERLAETHELYRVAGSRLPRLRPSVGPKFGILCYHRVGTEGVPLFSRLEPKVFEAQMRYVKKNYRVVPLRQLCRELQDGRRVEPTLAITFDDGYRGLYSYAFPLLQKYQIPATIYLIGRCMETGEVPWYDRIFLGLESAPGPSVEVNLDGPRRFTFSTSCARGAAAWEIVRHLRTIPDIRRREWCAAFERQIRLPQEELEGRMLDWQQVRTMHHAGVSFGAHTMSHPVLSQLDLPALEEELVQSKRLLEGGLDAPIEDFAYPFGHPEDRSLAAEKFLENCGYCSAVTTTYGFNTTGTSRFRLRRMQIEGDQPSVEFALSLSQLFLESPADMGSPR